MRQSPDQILTAAQMRAAEAALIAGGTTVDALMLRAGQGAADYVWRIASGRPVTVLCGPGHNGGDGYVIAEALRARGGTVAVIAAMEPRTEAAKRARARFSGLVQGPEEDPGGAVLVDCLFGTGLARPLAAEHVALLQRLSQRRSLRVAVDLPSGVASDSGVLFNEGLPGYDLTLALGAWKFAHWLMPACAVMGALRLVPLGIGPVTCAAEVIGQPLLRTPAADAHKYRRGLLGVVAGAMPGASILAATAAQRAGAGYVRLLADSAPPVAPDLVVETAPLSAAMSDRRFAALLVGPGLGRDRCALARLEAVLASPVPAVLDADALVLLGAGQPTGRTAPLIATPHDGELAALERAFDLPGTASKPERALALAQVSGMVIVAKGPDTVVAEPGGRIACARRGSPWLSTAGTGDVLAGAIASRLAAGVEPFAAACEGVWLHGEAARLAGPAFTASQLSAAIRLAFAGCC